MNHALVTCLDPVSLHVAKSPANGDQTHMQFWVCEQANVIIYACKKSSKLLQVSCSLVQMKPLPAAG